MPKSSEVFMGYHREVCQKVNVFHPIHFISFGFLSGLLKPASGTWGSAMGVLLATLCIHFLKWGGDEFFIAFVAIGVVGIYCCSFTTKKLGVHDHSAIVIDEIWGIFFMYGALYNLFGEIWTGSIFEWQYVCIALGIFVSFRLFDIWKPFPIRLVDKKLSTGFGIMFDDLLAGIYAIMLCLAVLFVFARN